MAKRVKIASYDIDTASVLKKIQEIKSQLKGTELNVGVPHGALKELEEIEKKLITLQKKTPLGKDGGKAAIKHGEGYERIAQEIENVFDKLSNTKFLDKDIKKNIQSVSELTEKWEDAIKKVNDYKEKIKGDSGIKATEKVGRFDDKTNKMRTAMADAATTGVDGKTKIKKEYDSMKDRINARRTQVEGWTNSPESQKKELAILKEREKNVEAIYRSALRYAENQQVLIDNEKKLNQEVLNTLAEKKQMLSAGMDVQLTELKETISSVRQLGLAYTEAGEKQKGLEESSESLDYVSNRLKDLFSLATVLGTLQQVIRGAVQDFMELDKQFNNIAIVSNYSTKEMWSSFSDVNKIAQDYGVTTQNVLEVQDLYYHQGKDMAEVNKLTAQTLNLAKITGMEYEDATNKMTAALNAYKIAAEDANQVTDTVAALSANAATSSEELMTALTKTASIAANSGMSLESTEVFLTKMIETTREAPENLGTALKTIIARFGEVKQEIDGEEIELADINRVDKSLKTIGISLLDTSGQVRDLEDVFMELSSQWDGLDRNTQRYIATMSAGSRQQSRFIAMMEDYDRTLELTNIAQNSAGTGAEQLAKAMESIESSLNTLKSSWQEFYSNILTSDMLKGLINAANTILSTLNELPGPFGAIVAGITMMTLKTQVLNKVLALHAAKMKIIRGEADANNIKQLYSIELDKRKEASLFNLIKQYVSLGKAGKDEKKTSEKATKVPVRKKAKEVKQDSKKSDDKIVVKAIDKSSDEKSKKMEQIRSDIQGHENATRQANKQLITEIRKLKSGGGTNPTPPVNGDSDPIPDGVPNKKRKKGEAGVSDLIDNIDFDEKGGETPDSKKGAKWAQKITDEIDDSILHGIDDLKQGGKFKKAVGNKLGSLLTDAVEEVAEKGSGKIAGKVAKNAGVKAGAKVVGGMALKGGVQTFTKMIPYIGAVITAIEALVKVYKLFMDQTLDDTKKIEKLNAAQSEYTKTLEKHRTALKNVETVRKYNLKSNLTVEQLQEEQEAIKGICEEYPQYLDYIDEEGNYHLKNIDSLETELKLHEQLNEAAEKSLSLRATYAAQGLYADENTRAGKAMKNINDFSATLSEDMMKDIANTIDTGGTFDKSKWYDAVEAYASGEKMSFGYKEFSSWFAGDIGSENWKELLELVQANDFNGEEIFDDAGKVNVDAFAKALDSTDAYGGKNAERAAEAFAELNEQTGNIYAEMLRGAAEEQDQIMIESAKINIQAANLNISSEFEQSMARFVADKAGDLTWWEEVETGLSQHWLGSALGFTNVREQKTENEGDPLINAWDRLTDSTVESIQNTFAKEKAGGLTGSELEALMNNEGVDDKVLLQSYLDGLDIERVNLEALDDEIIEFVAGHVRDSIEGIDYEKLGNKFSDLREELSEEDREKLEQLRSESTIDQQRALLNVLANLTKEQQGEYFNAIDSILADFEGEMKNNIKNALISVDVTTPEGILTLQRKLIEMGLSSEKIRNIIEDINIDDTKFLSAEQAMDAISSDAEKFQSAMDSIGALLEGAGSLSDVENYLNQMVDTFERLNQNAAEAQIVDLVFRANEAISATGDGFKIAHGAAVEFAEGATYSMLELIKQTLLSYETISSVEEAIAFTQLENMYRQISAQSKKAIQDGVVEDLEEAKESADNLKDALQNLVNWFMDFDRYANLSRVKESLEQDLEDMEFNIDFSTNADVVAKNIEDSINNLNDQIALNQAGINAAEQEQKMWRDVINSRYGSHVNFDEEGNAIVNASQIQATQKEIFNRRKSGDSEGADALQAWLDGLNDTVEGYTDARKAADDYYKAQQEAFKKQQEVLKDAYDSITKVEDLIIKTVQESEDEQLEAVQKKYEAIQKENDEYLKSIRDMVDEERRIRDRADREEEVKDKERKLAMMKMDTSGVYDADIRSLEKELERDYQDLEDQAVDDAIDKISKEYEAEKEAMDSNLEHWQNFLQEKRDSMTEYNVFAQNLMQQGSDAVLNYLKTNNQEYVTASQAGMQLLNMEWSNTVTQGVVAAQLFGTGVLTNVRDNLKICTKSAGGFKTGIEEYSKVAQTEHGKIEGSLTELTSYYDGLAGGVKGVLDYLWQLDDAYLAAASAARDLKDAQGQQVIGDRSGVETPPYVPEKDDNIKTDAVKSVDYKVEAVEEKDWGGTVSSSVTEANGIGYRLSKIENGEYYYVKADDTYATGSVWWVKPGGKPLYTLTPQFAKGGYVDYTGPAWVDGTKNHPEYMLNAAQTAQFEALVSALEFISSKNNSLSQPLTSQAQKLQDASYNFTINVSKMDSDYDVDKMIDRIEEKMKKASQYRNITVLKKTQ